VNGPRPTKGWVFWFLAAFVGFTVWSVSPSAQADEPEPAPPFAAPEALATEPGFPELPACASGVPTYEGEDPVVGELRALRFEAEQTCAALVARQEAQLHRLWWGVAELVELQADGEVTQTKLDAIKDVVTSVVPVNFAGPQPVEDSGAYAWLEKLKEQGEGVSSVNVANDEPIEVADLESLQGLENTQAATEVNSEVTNRSNWVLIGVLVGGLVFGWATKAIVGWRE
jgi:hypothetical protein